MVVTTGDTLWSLAADHLDERWGRPATETEITRHWVEVVAANEGRIRSGDPDVVYPGEIVVLPDT
ncbi:MAG: LysM peptidoglycan-binding domain-containing protein [Acidimicrobiia bacterium]